MASKAKGNLIIIGGHEDKNDGKKILKIVANMAKEGNDRLVIIAAATTASPEEQIEEYTKIFKDLGVKNVDALSIRERPDAYEEKNVELIKRARVFFFTGGDQLRITSMMGDSPIYMCLQQIYNEGGTIAGTSAGAAVMSETMLIAGPGDESNRIDSLNMAPGLGLLKGVVIDSHFAERGRMGRLLGAVSQNPANIGLGIDEDTAIIVQNQTQFRVTGSGAVYVVDGSGISYTSLSEKSPNGALSLYNVKLHVLADGDRYDLRKRQPMMDDGETIDPRATPSVAMRESLAGEDGKKDRATAGKH
jgi:cyanophycinase